MHLRILIVYKRIHAYTNNVQTCNKEVQMVYTALCEPYEHDRPQHPEVGRPINRSIGSLPEAD